MKAYSALPQSSSLTGTVTIRLFVISRTLVGGGVLPRCREAVCILQPQLTGHEVTDGLTMRELGWFVGWLRTACSFIKKQTGTDRWEDKIDQEVSLMRQEVIPVRKEDPIKGEGNITRTAEDAAWLRKKADSALINVAELDATMKSFWR